MPTFFILHEINFKNLEVISFANNLLYCLDKIGLKDNKLLVDKTLIEYSALHNYQIVHNKLIRVGNNVDEYEIILSADVQTVGELRKLVIDTIPEKII